MEVVNKPDCIEITDTTTGQIKTIKLVTDKQLKFILDLERQAGISPRTYRNLTIWQATKVVKRLKEKTSQVSLL